MKNSENTSNTVQSSTKSEVQKLELPHYTKFLLIAAYLASHNDAKIDKRLFVKHHGKQKKRLQTMRTKAVVSIQLDSISWGFKQLNDILYSTNIAKKKYFHTNSFLFFHPIAV